MEIVFILLFLIGALGFLYCALRAEKKRYDELNEFRSRLLESLNRIGDKLNF